MHLGTRLVATTLSLALVSTGRPADGVHTHYGLILQLWPGGERRVVAHADFHGAWIDWLG